MTYLFTHLKKGESEPSAQSIKARSVWEAQAKFRVMWQYSIIKSIRIKRGK